MSIQWRETSVGTVLTVMRFHKKSKAFIDAPATFIREIDLKRYMKEAKKHISKDEVLKIVKTQTWETF